MPGVGNCESFGASAQLNLLFTCRSACGYKTANVFDFRIRDAAAARPFPPKGEPKEALAEHFVVTGPFIGPLKKQKRAKVGRVFGLCTKRFVGAYFLFIRRRNRLAELPKRLDDRACCRFRIDVRQGVAEPLQTVDDRGTNVRRRERRHPEVWHIRARIGQVGHRGRDMHVVPRVARCTARPSHVR